MNTFDDGPRVLVTGGTGFLGQHLVKKLRSFGPMSVLSIGSSEYDLRNARDAHEALTWAAADTSPPKLVVFHLAASCGGIGANMKTPAEFAYDNMMMGLNVLEAASRSRLRKLVLVGTTCSYPAECPVPFREDDLWNGYPEATNAPYGVVKRALITVAQAYRQQYGLDVVTLIPANMYGPEDHFDLETSHVVPAMIRKFVDASWARSNHEPVTLWGDGSPTRELLYVEDCADALIRAAECYSGPEPINIGTGKSISMKQLAAKIAGIVKYMGQIRWDSSRPNGQLRRQLDVSRAREKLGWSAKTDLDEGLERTVRWYIENRHLRS